ncbi:hypothetical protein Cni_G00699 [Canna indica]|uniref:Uncharacterized protein n=1 Tax=Canna indica TaxID=4628 RepID=A0AAQ3JMW8_9LILI|nr:hypothetical protein Cni_G00699 [Canna indica]
MGCISSKILLTRSGSLKEEISQRLRWSSNGLEELLNSKKGGDQLCALKCTANTVGKTKAESPPEKPEENPDVATDIPNPEAADNEMHEGNEVTDTEIINAWDLLADLEEEKETEEHHQDQREKYSSICESETEFVIEDDKFMISTDELELNCETPVTCTEESDLKKELASKIGSRRKATAEEIATLKVPSIKFSKTISLKDWLRQGSPGSYITPKFGNFSLPEAKYGDNKDDKTLFDPDMLAQFEQAMNQLTRDEELILQHLMGSLEQGHKEDHSKYRVSKQGNTRKGYGYDQRI